MRIARLVNAAVWLAIWLTIAIVFHGFEDLPRLIGEAVIPGVLWALIDWILRRAGRSQKVR
jgi:hypothetical protein